MSRRRAAVAEPTEEQLKEQATERLVSREIEAIQEEAEERKRQEAEAAHRDKLIKAAQQDAALAVEIRAKLIGQFIDVLYQARAMATSLREAREKYKHALSLAHRLGVTLEAQMPPKPFGVDPTERDLLRETLTALQSIGGHV